MRATNLLLIPTVLVAGCVTSGDLMEISDSVRDLEVNLADESASHTEVEAALGAVRETVSAVAARVEERTESSLEGLRSAGEGGLVGLLGVLGLHIYRSATRRRDIRESNGGGG